MTKRNLYEIVSVYGTHSEYVSAAYVKELYVGRVYQKLMEKMFEYRSHKPRVEKIT